MGATINRLEKRALRTHEKRADNKKQNKDYSEKELIPIIVEIASKLSENADLVKVTSDTKDKTYMMEAIERIINTENYSVKGISREQLLKQVYDYVFKYALIQDLLDTPECNGVFVNAYNNIWYQVRGDMIETNISFGSATNLKLFVESVKASTSTKLDQNTAMAVADDKDNKLRIFMGVEPIMADGPVMVFRKHEKDNKTLKDLINLGMLSEKVADKLVKDLLEKKNIIIAGPNGVGKTTLMRALLEEIPRKRRILVMEDKVELYLCHPQAISTKLRTNAGDRYGIKEISEMGLMMRIDYFVFSEIKDGGAMALFNGTLAGNATMTTVHSNNASSTIDRMAILMDQSDTKATPEKLVELLMKSINTIVWLDEFKVKEIVNIVDEEFHEYPVTSSFEKVGDQNEVGSSANRA